MRTSVLAPVAVMVAVTSTPAHAEGPAGPIAGLAMSAVAAVPSPAADLARPVVDLPATTVDGILTTARGAATVNRSKGGAQDAVAKLGKGVLKTANGDVAFSGITAKCTAAADGTVSGATQILKGSPLSSVVPAAPAPGLRVPTSEPGVVLMLNKQVRDPLGGMTVSAISIDSAPGTGGITRDLGVARCLPAKELAGQAGAKVRGLTKGKVAPAGQRKAGDPVSDTVGGLLGALTGTAQNGLPISGGLGNPQGALPQLPTDPASVSGEAAGVQGRVTDMVGQVTQAAAPATGVAGALPVGAQGGLSGLLGGLPGLGGILPVTALPVLPQVPVAAPQLPAAPIGG
ncbi:hypothetical protein J4573_37730 [Actinomadura barringtoniae]|uniref:ATP-binding protein n=1 Tax=Actinomadura barringtoniae TaxID=1427535 RepID=A0A939PMP4_9ACTN|nr:hypothetical protein [Actinomadura barringtoniae]MBO2452883.1 hypothetical protein [Actinomadura barringtoniae]